jgi:hypothetical protein
MTDIVKYYSPLQTAAECRRESVFGNGHTRTIWFILCENAYSLPSLSKNYALYSALFGSYKYTTLARGIAMKDEAIVSKLPAPFINQIREWMYFFATNDIPIEYSTPLEHRAGISSGRSFEYRIVCESVLRDSAYKAFLPFTSMYYLSRHEDDIAKMMNDLTEYIHGVGIYVSCTLPYTIYDTPNEEDHIAKKLLDKGPDNNPA